MPSLAFLLASTFAAVVLGLITGVFGLWCGSRYGEKEKRYMIQAIPVLACTALFAYIDWQHRVFWSLGVFQIVYLLVPRLRRLLWKAKET